MDARMDDQPSRASPLLDHPIAVGFVLIVLAGATGLLWAASGVVLLGFLAVLFATLLGRPLDFFARFMPRVAALLLTVLLVLGALVGLVFLVVPVVSVEAERLSVAIPIAVNRLSTWWSHLQRTGPLPALPPGEALGARLMAELEKLLTHAVPFAIGAGSVIGTALVLFVLGLCLAYSPESYRDVVIAFVPKEKEPIVEELWRRLGFTLRRWTAGILAEMLLMGTLTALGLLLVGIDGWFLLGVLTFLFTFVPYVGAIASAVPGLLIGLSQSPLHMLYAAIVYAGVHIVEGYVAGPLIMQRSVRLRPALLLFWQLLAAAMFGLPGIIVATPLLACTLVTVGYLFVERRLGKEWQHALLA
jgi:predicted PurR-regulated permease PerM